MYLNDRPPARQSYALRPMPYALRPTPYALCPMTARPTARPPALRPPARLTSCGMPPPWLSSPSDPSLSPSDVPCGVSLRPMPYSLCPTPYALRLTSCGMPPRWLSSPSDSSLSPSDVPCGVSLCPMPYSLCPTPYASPPVVCPLVGCRRPQTPHYPPVTSPVECRCTPPHATWLRPRTPARPPALCPPARLTSCGMPPPWLTSSSDPSLSPSDVPLGVSLYTTTHNVAPSPYARPMPARPPHLMWYTPSLVDVLLRPFTLPQ